MKKKFSFVLAIIMVVCTLAIALVACAPKDPDPFTAVDSSKELGNIWDAWAKEHMNVSGNTLGINANINLKNSDTDMSIALQGGITQEKGVKEVLRLAVANNKKTGDNKNIVDIIINDTDGLFVNIDGLSQKPIKIIELKLPSIGNLLKEGLDMSISDILPAIKPAVVELINFALDDSKVTVDPVKNKKEYDVKYTFTVQVDALVNSILDMINLEMSPEVESIVNEVKAMLEDVNLKFTIDTTGNTQTKVKKPAKNAPKYEYKGGKMTDLKIEVEGMTVNATGINLTNSIPNIAIPTDTMDLDTALLTSRLNGTITMKDENGNSVGDYTYTINLDFEPIQLITTITECVNTGSPEPIINKMLLDQKGKIFIEIMHFCGDNCGATHLNSKKSNGSILAVAFAPEEFDNSRIYVSMDLKSILPDDIFTALGLEGFVANIAKGLIKEECYTFSFDVPQYFELIAARNAAPKDPEIPTEPTEPTEPETPVIIQKPFDFGSMISKIISGLNSEQELKLETADIIGVLGALGLDEGTYYTLEKVLNSLIPFNSVSIKAEYSNGSNMDEMKVRDLFIRLNDKENKKFASSEGVNDKLITGEVEYVKDKAGNIAIYEGKDKLHSLMYDAQGNYLPICYNEIERKILDPNMGGRNGKVQYTYTDIDGNEVNSYAAIQEIIGLDKTKFGTPQSVKLLIGTGSSEIVKGYQNGIGSSFNNLFCSVVGLSGMVPAISFLSGAKIPELLVDTQITLTEFEKDIWEQEAGNDKNIDTTKSYVYGNEINSVFNLSIKYKGVTTPKFVKSIEPSNKSTYIDSSNKIKTGSPFTLNYSEMGYTNSIEVQVNEQFDIARFNVVMANGKATYSMSTYLTTTITGSTSSIIADEIESVLEDFNTKYDTANATVKLSSGKFGGINFEFTEAGEYTITIKTAVATMAATFVVVEGADYKFSGHGTDKLYTGVTKTFNTKIGEYTFTKSELEKAVEYFNKVYTVKGVAKINASVAGDDSNPVLSITGAVATTYEFVAKNTEGKYVIVTFKVEDATASFSSIKLAEEKSLDVTKIPVNYTKAEADKAAAKFNTEYAGKATITVGTDETKPTLTFKSTFAQKYTLVITGVNNEIITISITSTVLTKDLGTIKVGDKITVTADDIGLKALGINYTKEQLQAAADNWNNNSIYSERATITIGDDEVNPTITIEILTYYKYSSTFTVDGLIKLTFKIAE